MITSSRVVVCSSVMPLVGRVVIPCVRLVTPSALIRLNMRFSVIRNSEELARPTITQRAVCPRCLLLVVRISSLQSVTSSILKNMNRPKRLLARKVLVTFTIRNTSSVRKRGRWLLRLPVVQVSVMLFSVMASSITSVDR